MVRTKGYCKYCGKEFTRAGILRHLATCGKRPENAIPDISGSKGTEGRFTLVISGKYNSDYWLVIDIGEEVTLRKLDQFLRDIWLECCGHLSAFTIDGVSYETYPEDAWHEARSMNIRLKKVLQVGMSIAYEYDFGSTTDLIIRVADYKKSCKGKEDIVILSRNQPLHIMCRTCGEREAKWISVQAMYSDSEQNVLLCDQCITKLEEEEPGYVEELYYLPVCNSPRMGVCGYEGSKRYPNEFRPDEA